MLKWGTTCDAFVTNYFVTNSMPKVVNSRGTVVTLSYPEFPSVFVQQRDPPSLLSPPSYPNSYSRQLLGSYSLPGQRNEESYAKSCSHQRSSSIRAPYSQSTTRIPMHTNQLHVQSALSLVSFLLDKNAKQDIIKIASEIPSAEHHCFDATLR